MGYFSLLIAPSFTIIIPKSIIYLIAIKEFLISLFFNMLIVYKKLKFIYSYPLECNPNEWVRGTLAGLAMAKPILKYTAAAGGSVMATNYFLQDFRGVNVIEEIGRNYIDGDKIGKETASIV